MDKNWKFVYRNNNFLRRHTLRKGIIKRKKGSSISDWFEIGFMSRFNNEILDLVDR